MLGAIFGDIVGSVYEFDNIKTKEFPLLTDACFFTDDTVMTLAVAKALCVTEDLENEAALKEAIIDQMQSFGKRYPDAGYGCRFGRWLSRGEREPYGSYGNGSAMRVSPCAWAATSLKQALRLARISAEVTHNHPEGIKGAIVTAGATYLALHGADKKEIRAFCEGFYDLSMTADEIRPTYSFNETCQNTVPQAIIAFLESESPEDALRIGVSLGGDSDTLCAICGAIAEGLYGLTADEEKTVRSYLDADLNRVVEEFRAKYPVRTASESL